MVTFRARVTATGLDVPSAVVEELGAGTPVPVRVSVREETYSATVRRRGEQLVVRMGAGHRRAAGVEPGDEVDVTLVHEPGRRHVEVPEDLAAALVEADLREDFEALPWSHRKEHALAVAGARSSATRERRVARIIARLG